MDFDFQMVFAESWIGPDVDRRSVALRAFVSAASINAWSGEQCVDRIEVGRWKSDLVSASRTVNYHAPNAIGPSEKFSRLANFASSN